MKLALFFSRRLRWLNLPGAVLLALLQRTPAVQVASTAAEFVAASPVGAVLRSASLVAASLGAIHSMAGATTLSTNSHPSPLSLTAGTAAPIVAFGVIGAQGLPGSWRIGGTIPAGLSFSGRTTPGTVNTSTLTLTGTPTTAGSFTVTLQAWEGPNLTQNSSPTFNYVINVAAGVTIAPAITTQPVSQTVSAGVNVTFTASASGTPAPTFQWSKDGVAIANATSATLTLGQVIASDAGNYSLKATNSAGSATSNVATLVVSPIVVTTPAPVFSVQPVSQTVATGSTVVFSIAASGATAFQWRLNGAPINGATSAMLVLTGTSTVSGSYSCAATNAGGTTLSNAATLSVGAFAAPSVGHLVNVSILTTAGTGAKALTVGATIGGGSATAALPLVVRAVGPSLGTVFGLSGVLSDPTLIVNAAGNPTPIATNDNWGGGTNMTAAFASVGAFALPAASLDSAFVALSPGLTGGGYTVQVSGKNNASGLVIAEIYDAGDATRTATTPRLINLSTLTSIDAGASLSAGFVLRGSTSRTLLVRGIGPSLAALGVGGVMGDPKLELFNNDTGVKIGENDNWGGDAQLTAAMASVGAFPLGAATTNDAVLLVTLPPGAYSARISDVIGAGGTAIVEIYEVP